MVVSKSNVEIVRAFATLRALAECCQSDRDLDGKVG